MIILFLIKNSETKGHMSFFLDITNLDTSSGSHCHILQRGLEYVFIASRKRWCPTSTRCQWRCNWSIVAIWTLNMDLLSEYRLRSVLLLFLWFGFVLSSRIHWVELLHYHFNNVDFLFWLELVKLLKRWFFVKRAHDIKLINELFPTII